MSGLVFVVHLIPGVETTQALVNTLYDMMRTFATFEVLVGLDPAGHYHAYEFWTDTYLGKLPGTARLARELEPNHCAMISVRKAVDHPQVISTNRHVLQGWMELKDVTWDAASKSLSGIASVIGGEPFEIVVATNGAKAVKLSAKGAKAELKPHPADGLHRLVLSTAKNADVSWTLACE